MKTICAMREIIKAITRFEASFEEVHQLSLNEAIEKDDALGEGFCIGHSYFSCLEGEDIKSRLHIVVKYEILPMLKEYWFDDRQKYLDWESTLTKILEE